MTREQAIKELTDLLPEEFLSEYAEAIRMGIKALEQEPCDDCISRQQAIDAIDALYLAGDSSTSFRADAEGDTLIGKYQAITALDDLQPVTPQQKKSDESEVLDKIKAEIDEQYDRVHPYDISCAEGLEMALGIIYKYKAEGSDKE